MQISRNSELETQIDSVLFEQEDRSSEVHITDLLVCLAQAYFRKVDPIPPTREAQSRMAIGSALGEYIQNRLNISAEVPIFLRDIHGRMDGVFKPDGEFLEIKTTFRSLRDQIPPHYLAQMKSYALMSNKNEASLAIVHIKNTDSKAPVILETECWKVFFSESELQRWEEEILFRADVLKAALQAQAPPPVFSPVEDWACKVCEYKDRCY